MKSLKVIRKRPIKPPPSQLPSKCYYCNKSFKQFKNLQRHHNIKHPEKVCRCHNVAILDDYISVSFFHDYFCMKLS